jgi:hypothetical protein
MGAAMKSMGLEENTALTYARGCGQSLTALVRLIPSGTYEDPLWLRQGMELLPAILAGSWDSNNEMDRGAIERIAGNSSYEQIELRLREFPRDADSPFDLEGSVWKVRAPMDAFIHVGTLIGSDQATRLRGVMLEVFGWVEPDVEPDQAVSFSRSSPAGHSEWLRDGLATTLLLFAIWSRTACVNLGSQSGQQFADGLLEELPGLNSDPRMLGRLKEQLPLLAEAAPGPLLTALEHMLEGNGELIRPIFDEGQGFLAPTYKHAGVLWALETIAWDPAYFRRAVLVLAGLAAIDPGVRIINTPANSLAEIFVLWQPNTNASSALRFSALKEISALYPNIGWTLVKKLLPRMSAVSSQTAKPRLREAGASDRTPVTYRDLGENQADVVRLAIDLAADDEARWLDLIRSVGDWAPRERQQALERLDQMMGRAAPGSRKRLWTKLRDEIARHERCRGAAWALPTEELTAFRMLAEKYAPSDPIFSVAALFHDLALHGGDLSNANQRRSTALRRLYQENGPDSLVRLAAIVRVPYMVVEALDAVDFTEVQMEELLRLSFMNDRESELTHGISGIYRRIAGPQRAEVRLRELSDKSKPPDVLADLLQTWPDSLETWGTARRFGPEVVASFWRRRGPRHVTGSRRTLLQSLLMLLRYGRAITAIQSSIYRFAEVPTELML